MPRVSPQISNFTAGEWSPHMMGQADLAQWKNACRTMLNFFPRVTGGAQKRPGTVFVAEVKDSSKRVRLIPFQYSTLQAYVIEAGDYYMRFIRDNGQVVTTSGTPYEIGSPYGAADIGQLRFAQDKDLMYMFHQSYPVQKITRYDHDDWEIYNAPLDNGPYQPVRNNDEIGVNLCTNGEFEEDTGITSIGTPLVQKRTDVRIYSENYARVVAMSATGQGFLITIGTTTTGKQYVVRFRVFTRATSILMRAKQGGASAYNLNEEIDAIADSQWLEYSRYFIEASGGTAAQIEFESPDGEVLDDEELIANYDMTYEGDWTEDPDSTDVYWSADHTFDGVAGTCYLMINPEGTSGDINTLISRSFITETGKVYKLVVIWSGPGYITIRFRRGNNSGSVILADEKYVSGVSANTETFYYEETAGGVYAAIIVGTQHASMIAVNSVSVKEVKSHYYIDKLEVYEVDAITMAPSATTGLGITLTASSDFFESGHIGSFIQLTHGTADPGYARITGVTSGTVATIDVLSDFDATTATANWREGAFSWKNGYPACGAFYEQRLMMADTPNDPDGLWGSQTTEYDDFTPGTLASNALGYKLQSDIIRWLSPLGQLVAGTVNSEYRIGTNSSDTALTPTNIKLTSQGRKGSANIDPINAGNAILFVQRRGAAEYGKRLRELSYNYETDSFQGLDLTAFAEHITGSGIVRMALMLSPFPIVWACTADGGLIGCTYDKDQQVLGWHRHDVGGTVEDICIIPGAEQDDLYLLVNRSIGGVVKRYIEVLAPFDFGDDQTDAYFVDCGLTYDGTAATTITGLDHLEGEAVAILADGAVHDARTVASGQITLDYAASVVHVGLPYTSELEPMPLQGGSIEGTSEGKTKRIHGVTVYFYQTGGGWIGPDEDNLEPLVFRTTDDDVGEAVPLFTGYKDDFNFPGDWGLEATVLIRQTEPLPMTVLSMMPRFRTEDR